MSERPVVTSTHPRDAEIVAFTQEISKAALAALRGNPYDEKWDSPDLENSLADARAKLPAFDVEARRVMTAFVTEIVSRVDASKIYANDVGLFVRKDGGVRWMPPRGQFIDVNPDTYPTTSLAVVEDTRAPALIARHVARFKADLAPGKCSLRTLGVEDFDALPLSASEREKAKRELFKMGSALQTTCADLATAKGKTSILGNATRVITLLMGPRGLLTVEAKVEWNADGLVRMGRINVVRQDDRPTN